MCTYIQVTAAGAVDREFVYIEGPEEAQRGPKEVPRSAQEGPGRPRRAMGGPGMQSRPSWELGGAESAREVIQNSDFRSS